MMMHVWNDIHEYPSDAGPVIVTIGNYDGLHLGHQAIIRRVTEAARSRRLRSLLVTFDPHPMTVVAPERRPRLLVTRGQKLDRLEALGLDGVLIVRFDETVAALSGADFFSHVLERRLSIEAVHVGENFRFGHGRRDDIASLRRIGDSHGFEVVGIAPVSVGGETVSSSAIRAAVEHGKVERAWQMLSRPFELTGRVVRGEGRGRSMDFPTANLDVDNEMIPARGVYVTEASAVAGSYPSVSNIGNRPTFGGASLVVESHLLDFDDDLYDERLELRFLARLRDEMRFSGPLELADQIARDCAAAAAYFQNQQVRIR